MRIKMELNQWTKVFRATVLLLLLSRPSSAQCRSKVAILNETDFNLNSCAWCYFFLFQNTHKSLSFSPNFSNFSDVYLIVRNNITGYPVGTKLIADATNVTSRSEICSTLSPAECGIWSVCCEEAAECCSRQQKLDKNNDHHGNGTCRSTWDGFGCWDDATAGTQNHIACPSFIKFSVPTRSAVKTCLANGTWLRKSNMEWTDYTPCLNYEELRITIYISLACQIASLTLLIPALLIFLLYKSLRRQHRIRLHINFFISFVMNGICVILWNLLVTYDKLTNPSITDTLMHRNVVGCKVLSFMKLYFTSTNYVWMFCEGLYLYRLIANAFSPPKRLILIYIGGWGVPFLYSLAYAILRASMANESCWALSLGGKEWIMYTPNLACLVANIFFLCSILRILLTQLQAHPNEPSNFRRALKATFVLIPLFGVQLIVTIKRIPQDAPGALHYERFSEVVSNSQGFVVALIFCFCNGEVASQIKRSWRRHCWEKISGSRKFNTTLSLNFNNSLTHRISDPHTGHNRKESLEPCLKSASDTTSATTLQSQF